jgi:hypothetical protein
VGDLADDKQILAVELGACGIGAVTSTSSAAWSPDFPQAKPTESETASAMMRRRGI